MKCPKCGMNINEDSRMCIHCGYIFNVVEENPIPENNVSEIQDSINVIKYNIAKRNLFRVVPSIVVFFIIVTMLSGLNADASFIYLLDVLCAIYVVISIVFYTKYKKYINDTADRKYKEDYSIINIIGMVIFVAFIIFFTYVMIKLI